MKPEFQAIANNQKNFDCNNTTRFKQNVYVYKWPQSLPEDPSNPSLTWSIGSHIIVPIVGLFGKFWLNVMNRSKVYNLDIFQDTINKNYLKFINGDKRCPLITYTNHQSCLDDPFTWGALMPFTWLFNSNRLRWTAGAADICFSKKLTSLFFALGRTFPMSRGDGIYQPGMNYALRLIQHGHWLHIFPEGRIFPRLEFATYNIFTEEHLELLLHPENRKYQLKWGLARLIIEHVLGEGEIHDNDYYQKYHKNVVNIHTIGECLNHSNTLREVDVLPIYHCGMDEVLPSRRPYIPKVFKRVTFLVRPDGPIHIDKKFLMKLFSESNDNENSIKKSKQSSTKELTLTEKRICLTNYLEKELDILAAKAKAMHFSLDKK